jgi:hypothetical protein
VRNQSVEARNGTQEITYTFNALGGSTVFATTALSHVNTYSGSSAAWAYFSEYSDASGSHPISGQTTTWLIISGATSVTLSVHVYNGYAQSITTLWFYQ